MGERSRAGRVEVTRTGGRGEASLSERSARDAFARLVLSAVRRVIPAPAAFFGLSEGERAPLDIARVADGALSIVRCPLSLPAFFGFDEVAAAPEEAAVVLSDGRQRTAAYFCHYSSPDGFARTLLARLCLDGASRGVVGVERRASDPPFRTRDREAPIGFEPLVVTALRAQRLAERFEREIAALRSVAYRPGDLASEALAPVAPIVSVERYLSAPRELPDRDRAGAFYKLSRREGEIAQLLVAGYSQLNIGARCGLSVNTVRTYMRRLYRKLGVFNRADLVRTLLKASHSQAS